jgi:DNA-binding protein H-NS
MDSNTEMANLSELLAQKAALDQAIASLQVEQRASAIAKVRELMAEHGLTVADLSTRAATAAPKAPKAAGSTKVAAKYRDDASGSTWSGRGLKPRWLTAALAAGKKTEDFAV